MRGAVSMALAYNKVKSKTKSLLEALFSRFDIADCFVSHEHAFANPSCMLMQFAMAETKARNNAFMITSTITVVLFSTVVSH